MAETPSLVSSGSQTAVIGTEHVLLDQASTAGVYVLVVDTSVMAAADALELRIYRKARTGDTYRVCYFAYFENAQDADNAIQISVPVVTVPGAKFTLKQTQGTGRAFLWAVEAL